MLWRIVVPLYKPITDGLNNATRIERADPGTLTCFADAARACKSASIHIYQPNLYRAGTNYVFSVEAGTSHAR